MSKNLYIRFLCGLSVALLSAVSVADMRDIEIPFYDAWVSSPHGDVTSEAFAHWEEEDDKLVPERCAACHSTTGHLDFLGVDGTEAYKVDNKAPGLEGVQCTACHNKAIGNMVEVTFPSGMVVEREEADARCMDCHQGRASGKAVNDMIAKAGVADDVVHEELKFLNVHYSAAAATRFGTEAGGGYEYEGQDYNGLHYHDDFATQCNDCHSPHKTSVKIDFCVECHEDTGEENQWAFIRADETEGDFDGNGEESGIKTEVENMHEMLYQAIKDYAAQVTKMPIIYDSHAYPYFFNDSNANGEVDKGEGIYPNAYKSWTPRIAQAAYNYQFVAKDHGAWVHNGQYVLQLMHDSIKDLGEKVDVPVTERPEVY
jgi:hypothetical protein